MKVPTIEEAHKIVSDADLGIGCVIDEKELMLARFVFENSPVRSPELFRKYLQQIVDASAAERAGDLESSSHRIATHVYNGFINIERSIYCINVTLFASFCAISFILGVILYKLS